MSVSSLGDKSIAIAITVVVAVFLFWFIWPSPEDDEPFAEQDYTDGPDDNEADLIDYRDVFDKIIPNLRCDMAPEMKIVRHDEEAFFTLKVSESLHDVALFVESALKRAGYHNSTTMNLALRTVGFEITYPSGFELLLTQSTKEENLFIITVEFA